MSYYIDPLIDPLIDHLLVFSPPLYSLRDMLKLLLVRMPNSELHELAAHVFEEIFLDAAQEIGMKRSLKKTGSRAC